MAFPVEKLVIQIAGDSTKFKAELKKIKSDTGGFEKTMKSAAVVGKASFLAIGTAAATLGTVATKAFADFETGVTNVAKTTNLGDKELEKFTDQIIALSEEIPVTTDKLLEIATAAGQLGIKGGENLTKFTEVIAKLGRTTNVEGEEAALAIARILNLTNESIDSVDKLGSTLVDLGNNFAASEAEILEVAKDVAKATVQFKLSSAEILGMSASMASLGIAAEAGGTVVGKAFQAIDQAIRSQGGPAFEKLIELTGMSGDALTKTFEKDASKVFESFINGLGDAESQGANLTDEMGALGLSGIRVNKILPTLASRSDILADAMKRAGIASKDAAALNEEAGKAFGTTASKLQIAQNKLNNTLIELGENIAPVTIKVVEDLSTALKDNSGAISAIGKSIAATIRFVGGFFKTLDDLTAKWAKLGTDLAEKRVKKDTEFLRKEYKKRGLDYDDYHERRLEIARKSGEILRKQTEEKEKERIRDEKNFLLLKEKLEKDAAREREEATRRAEEGITEIEDTEQSNRAKQLELSKEEKFRIEKNSIEQLKLLNEAEIDLALAKQRGASDEEIAILQAKFDSIKAMQTLENGLIVAEQGRALTELETEQNNHKTNLLAIEQAKFDDILSKQDAFELDSQESQEDYLTGGSDSLVNQEIDAAAEIKATRDANYEQLETDQDGFEERSAGSWKKHREDVQKDIDDNPITFETDFGGGGGDLGGVTITTLPPDLEAEAEKCAKRGLDYNPTPGLFQGCCGSGYVYVPGNSRCTPKPGETTVTDTGKTQEEIRLEEFQTGGGDDHLTEFSSIILVKKSCKQQGLDYNPVFNNCCNPGTLYSSHGVCREIGHSDLGGKTSALDTQDEITGFGEIIEETPGVAVQRFCNSQGLIYNPTKKTCCGSDEKYDQTTGNCIPKIFTYEIVGAAASKNVIPSGDLQPQSIDPIFGKKSPTGAGIMNQTVSVEISLNQNAAEVINAQIKEGIDLGTITGP